MYAINTRLIQNNSSNIGKKGSLKMPIFMQHMITVLLEKGQMNSIMVVLHVNVTFPLQSFKPKYCNLSLHKCQLLSN